MEWNYRKFDIDSDSLDLIKDLSKQLQEGFIIFSGTSNHEIKFYNDRIVELLECDNRKEFESYIDNDFYKNVLKDDFESIKDVLGKFIPGEYQEPLKISYKCFTNKGNIRNLKGYVNFAHTEEYGDIFYSFVSDSSQELEYQSMRNVVDKIFKEQRKLEHLVDVKLNKRRLKNKAFYGTKILLVDEDELTRVISRNVLEEEGANIYEADNGERAMSYIKRRIGIDAIIMDILSPFEKTIEAINGIRDLEKNFDNQIPIFILSSKASDEQIEMCLEAGANDYMDKPFVVSEFARAFVSCMREQTMNLERRLADTIRKASTDVLTSVKNIAAYTEKVADLSRKMVSKEQPKYAIVMCDINSLKYVNDNFGHDVGDTYIKNCCRIICNVFIHSPVYRIGGDEFVVVLQNSDYKNREFLMEKLVDDIIEAEKIGEYKDGKASLAAGIAVYDHKIDYSFADVVKRADAMMYKYKQAIKR